MRESIGGAWLVSIVVLFIVLFSGYLAVSINYTKAFKVKNYIINVIEQNEGFTKYKDQDKIDNADIKTLEADKTAQGYITAYLKSTGYYTTESADSMKKRCNSTSDDLDVLNNTNSYYDGGYCIKKICTSMGTYYKVTTFIKFQVPIIQTSILIDINGETKPIFFDNSEVPCYNES